MNAHFPSPRGPAAVFRLDEAALRRRAADAAEKIVALGVERMVRPGQRHLITRAVYPFAPTIWPIPGKPATEVLADCSRLLRAQQAHARRGEMGAFKPDFDRMRALQQAESALLRIILDDGPEPQEAA